MLWWARARIWIGTYLPAWWRAFVCNWLAGGHDWKVMSHFDTLAWGDTGMNLRRYRRCQRCRKMEPV